MAGTSGATGERLGPPTPNARSFPVLVSCSTAGMLRPLTVANLRAACTSCGLSAVDENNEMKLKEWDDLKEVKRNKSFQLLMYAYLFDKTEIRGSEKISSGILSFRELSKGVKQITFDGKAELDAEILKNFEAQLKILVEEILNPNIHFEQTRDTEICEYCAFKLICNR